MDCERDGELRVELNRSVDILVGVLMFEHVCKGIETRFEYDVNTPWFTKRLTSLKTSDVVEMLSFLIFVSLVDGPGAILSPGDVKPVEFNRLSGDEKSSRSVIMWLEVITNVQPSVLCRSCNSNRPLADWTSACSHSDATYSSGAANWSVPVFSKISKQCGRVDCTARRAPLHSVSAITIDGNFLFESANIYNTPALRMRCKSNFQLKSSKKVLRVSVKWHYFSRKYPAIHDWCWSLANEILRCINGPLIFGPKGSSSWLSTFAGTLTTA